MELTPPEAPLELAAPEPVALVKEDDAPGMIPAVSAERKLTIGAQAQGFVQDLVRFTPNSPEFTDKLTDIQKLADREIRETSVGPNRLLERSIAASKARGGDASSRVAGTLGDLRAVVTDLTPNAADLTRTQKLLGFLPGGKKVRRYFQKYESAQGQLDAIVKSLMAGQTELQKDNAALAQEKQHLWETMGQLNEYIVLAGDIDAQLVAQIDSLKQAGNLEAASALEADMLFAVRQRRQDLLTQLTVAVQGYMSMELVRKNNVELIKGVDRARSTTITALRTAVITAQALDSQRLVLDQLDAVKETTERTILATSEMLKAQTARIHEQASSPAVSVEVLKTAFDNIFQTLDAVDTFRTQANTSMQSSIDALSMQLDRAKPQFERARALEASQ
jgi:uncharacterized protein YaaN involved in tellurite resistance